MDIFGLSKPKKVDDGTSLLTTTHDEIELTIIKSILEGEEIPYMVGDRGVGGAMRVISGYSMFGTDVFVPTECMEKATELLDAYRNGEVVEDDGDVSEEEN